MVFFWYGMYWFSGVLSMIAFAAYMAPKQDVAKAPKRHFGKACDFSPFDFADASVAITESVEEAGAFCRINTDWLGIVRIEYSPHQREYLVCCKSSREDGECEQLIRLERVYAHIEQDYWDARDDVWRKGCMRALAILAKMQPMPVRMFW
jgi:hypothetical protein